MKYSGFKRYGIALIAIILSISLVMPVVALNDVSTSSANEAVVKDSIGRVDLSGRSYIELKEMNILPSEAGQSVTFTFSIYNGESTDLSFNDYWVRLRTKAGARITSSLIGEDHEKNRIAPQSSQEYTFHATVNASVQLSDLMLEFIRWDFTAPNYERKLGEVRVPNDYTNVVPVNAYKNIAIQNSVIKTSVDRMEIREDEEFYKTSVYFDIENTGLRSVVIPNYTFYIRTSEGLMYALQPKDFDNSSVPPRMIETVELNANIPIEFEQKDWDLVVIQPTGVSSIEIPKGFYRLPEPSTKVEVIPDGVPLGEEQEIEIDEKLFGVTLNSIQRLPWNDEDIISAEVALSNLDEESLPLPNLSAYFNLDGVKIDESNTVIVHLDNILGLPAKSKTTFIMYTKIPYTYEYDTVDLVIINKDIDIDEDESKLVNFQHDSKSLALPVIEADSQFQFKNIGKRANVSIKDVVTFKGTSSNVFYVEVEMENLEKRQTELAKLTGYLKTTDDVYFPVNISEVNQRITPNGKALMSFWSTLPLRYNTHELQLIIGEEITTSGDEAFIQVAAYDLPVEKITRARSEFENIKVYPYDITLTNMRVSLSNNAKVNFDYHVNKANEYEALPDGHKLIIELVDGDIGYSQEFTFESELKVGSHQGEMIANMNIENVMAKMQSIDGFRFNVYSSFEGHKKLLASRMIYRISSGF